MKKYGLQLRINPQQQKQHQPKKPMVLPTAPGFGVDDDDEDDVEMEIARHAAKNRALKEVSVLNLFLLMLFFNCFFLLF